MAGMDGFQTASLIKQRPRSRHIPIIFITAVGRDAAHVFRGYSEGAVDYLVKPFDPDILRAKAQVFVDLYLKEERIKAQEKLLREHERAALLRAGEERYRQLLDSARRASGRRARTGAITFWNRAGLEYHGHETAAVTRRIALGRASPRRSRRRPRGVGRGVRRGRRPFERQIRLRRAADGTLPLAPRARGPRAGERRRRISGWIATATDIDDQKKAEQTLREAIGLREDFLSVASHELRTPLTSLRLEVENLLRFARRSAGEAAARGHPAGRADRRPGGAAQSSDRRAARRVAHRGRPAGAADRGGRPGRGGRRGPHAAGRRGAAARLRARGAGAGRAVGRLGREPPRPGDHQPALERHQVRRRQADRDHRRRRPAIARCWRSTTTGSASRPRIRTGSSGASSARPPAGTTPGSGSGSGSSSRSSMRSAAR